MGGVTRLLLLLWAAVTVSSAVDLQKRIIGGQPCGPGVRRYHVKFTDVHGGLICGGSLISDQWILTAAHCMGWATIAEVPVNQGPNHIELISAQPEIYRDNNKKLHDIMLLKLSKSLTQAQPVPLPDAQDCNNLPNPGVQVQIAGYGPAQVLPNGERDNNDRPAQLQCANIPVVNCQNYRNTALNTPQNRFFKIVHGHNHWICAQSQTVDIAGGDSGGGVEYNGKIHGVISAMGNGRFPFRQPAIFMDVCKYMPWIEKTVGIGILNKIRKAIKKRLR